MTKKQREERIRSLVNTYDVYSMANLVADLEDQYEALDRKYQKLRRSPQATDVKPRCEGEVMADEVMPGLRPEDRAWCTNEELVKLRTENEMLRRVLDRIVGEIRCHDDKCIGDNGALDCLRDLYQQSQMLVDMLAGSPSESDPR